MATSGGDDFEDDSQVIQDGGGKKAGKKFLHPFRKMRRFFSSRRRVKSREEEEDAEDPGVGGVTVKSKSTTDVQRATRERQDNTPDDECGPLASNKTLSMSADSVFTPDPRPKDASLEGLKASARSMEHLVQPAFASELFQKLKNRRADDDDGLPSSPDTQSTNDVLEDFKKPMDRRHDSKHSVDSSMYSSEDELEDKNVFDTDWTTAGTTKPTAGTSDSNERLDFDILSSTASLSSASAKHKISVKPKNLRPSTNHRRPAKSPVPTALAQVEEKEESKVEDSEDVSGASVAESKESLRPESRNESLDGTRSESSECQVEIHVRAEPETSSKPRPLSDSSRSSDDVSKEPEEVTPNTPAADEEKVTKPVERPVQIVIAKPEVKPKNSPVPSPRSPRPAETKVVVEPEPEKAPVVAEKTAVEKETAEPEKKEAKTPAKEAPAEIGGGDDQSPFNVKLRKTAVRKALDEQGTIRLRDQVGDRDPTKRQTIAGDTGLTIFGERRAGQRTSFVEVARSPDTPEAEAENEFSQVLNRLKKQPSRKKLIPGEDEKSNQENKVAPEKASVVEAKPRVSETQNKVSEPKPNRAEISPKVQKVVETKPKVPEGKPKPKISENKPRISESKPKIETKHKVVEAKPVDHGSKPAEVKKIVKEEASSKETVIISKKAEAPKESIVIAKKSGASSPEGRSEEPSPTPVAAETPSKPNSEKKPQVAPAEPSPAPQPEPQQSKTVVIDKAKPTVVDKAKTTGTDKAKPTVTDKAKPTVVDKAKPAATEKARPTAVDKPKSTEAKKVTIEKADPKPKDESKVEEKPFKRDSPIVKNRARSQTLIEQPVTATKESAKSQTRVQRSSSHSEVLDEQRADPATTSTIATTTTSSSTTTTTTTTAPTKVAEVPVTKAPAAGGQQESGRGSEPAWLSIARRKTANWDQKERDLEQKEKKETSNQAEKERDAASTKGGKEGLLTIDEAAKEDSKPALRNAGKCSNSAASRQSKVLDIAKKFQSQVS